MSTRSSQTRLVKIGTFLGFDTRTYGGDVWVTPALGGQARRLAEGGNLPVWNPNGRSIIFVAGPENRRAIMTVPVEGGTPTAILPSSESAWEITRLGFSPDARWITFETNNRELLVMPAGGSRHAMRLLEGSSHVWDRNARRLYYANQQSTGGSRIEAAEIRSGTELPQVERIWVAGVSTGTLRDLALAPDGTRMLAAGVDESLNLTRIRLTPDGGEVTGPEEALSTGHVRDRFPAVSPDGDRIVVSTNRIGDNGLWIVAPDTGRWAEPLGQRAPTINGTFACAFSPDGQQLPYVRIVEGFSQLLVFDLATRRTVPLTRSRSHKYQAAWSPDGHWISFSANAEGTVHVWRIPATGGQEEQLTSGVERYLHMFYSPEGRWLYLQQNHGNISRMPANGGPLRAVTSFPTSGLFLEEPTIAPNGQYLVYNRGRGGSSLWMLTFKAAPSNAGQ